MTFADVLAFLDTYGGAMGALATLVIAAFTGTLWWSTHKLWKASTQALQGDRAWMTFQGIAGRYDEANKTATFPVRWINSGRSPAINVRAYTTTRALRPDKNTDPFAKPDFSTLPPVSPIGQGQTRSIGHDPQAPDFTQPWREGRMRLMIYSCLRYNDVFSKQTRFSEYCGFVSFAGTIQGLPQGQNMQIFFQTYGPQNTVS